MALGYTLTVREALEYYDPEPDIGPAGYPPRSRSQRRGAAHFLARAAEGRTIRLCDYSSLTDATGGAMEAAGPTGLLEAARRFLAAAMPDGRPEFTPRRYPAFHAAIRRDVVLEVDAKHSQRECFDRSRPILEFLERYGAPYRMKYSGNCSVHFIIPQEAYQGLIPPERWEEDSGRFHHWAMAHCGVPVDRDLVGDNHPLRLPYSLHERTGLVSLPIDPGKYDDFRPEMAEVRNVRVEETWFRTDDFADKRDGMLRMLREALGDEKR
jgi:hypothetical protein